MWISKQVLKKITSEADEKYPNETGGVLVGYRSDNGEYVVLDCTGPGPRATHKRSKFIPDHGWQCQQLEQLYWDSHFKNVYLGDWHTHPNGSPYMSLLDRRTLLKIAKHEETALESPLMLIGGGNPKKWDWKIHRYLHPSLWGMIAITTSHEPKQF